MSQSSMEDYLKKPQQLRANCRHFSSSWDDHLECTNCRKHKCSQDDPCSTCRSWSQKKWDLFNNRQVEKEFRKQRKEEKKTAARDAAPSGKQVSKTTPALAGPSPNQTKRHDKTSSEMVKEGSSNDSKSTQRGWNKKKRPVSRSSSPEGEPKRQRFDKHLSRPVAEGTSAAGQPGVGVTKPIFSVPLFSTFSVIVKTNVSY